MIILLKYFTINRLFLLGEVGYSFMYLIKLTLLNSLINILNYKKANHICFLHIRSSDRKNINFDGCVNDKARARVGS